MSTASTHGYALVPVGELVTGAWLGTFEAFTEHGTGEGKGFTLTHWIIEHKDACEPGTKADIEAKGGQVFATAKDLIEHLNKPAQS